MGWAALLSFASVACTCAGPTYHARLSDARGLAAGAPVVVAGVSVGSVSEVRVVDAAADVSFTLSREHDITLRESTCAVATTGSEEAEGEADPGAVARAPQLELLLGDGPPLAEPRVLPECRLEPEDLVTSLSQSLGDLMRSLGIELQQGQAGAGGGPPVPPFPIPMPPVSPIPPLPQTPPPPVTPPPTTPTVPQAAGSPCATLAITVEGVTGADPVPLHLPQGGARVMLLLRNDGERTITTGPITSASFVLRGGEAIAPATLPASDDWFMPIDVPAHAVARATVTFARPAADLVLDAVELRAVASADDPLGVCVARASALAPH